MRGYDRAVPIKPKPIGDIMKTSVNFDSFVQAFADCNRSDNFSLSGLGCLFDYLESYEQDVGVELELDVIALCCEYSEYSSVQEVVENYDIQLDEEEDALEQLLEYLQENTSVVCCEEDCIVIQDF